MNRLLVAALFLCFSFCSARSQESAPVLCNRADLPLTWPKGVPLQPEKREIRFTSFADFSEAELRIANKSSTPLTQVAALIEILDKENNHLLTFAARAVAPGLLSRAVKAPDAFPLENGGRLATVLYPNDTTNLVPSNPRVLSVCPSTARLVFLQVDTIQQQQFIYSAPNVRTDARLTISSKPRLLPLPVSGAYEQFLRIRIAENGSASVVSLEHSPEIIADWITQLLSAWRFLPAESDGVASQDTVDFLFRFHPIRKAEWDDLEQIRSHNLPYILVDVYPPSDQEPNALVRVGHHIVMMD